MTAKHRQGTTRSVSLRRPNTDLEGRGSGREIRLTRQDFLLCFSLTVALQLFRISNLIRPSLHDWRFMSQAGRTRYFARSATRARSARRGEKKNKAPVRSPLFLLFRPPTPTNINYPRWCQKNQSKHAKIVTFLARSVCIAVDMASRTPTKVYGPKSFHSLCRTVLNSNDLLSCHI